MCQLSATIRRSDGWWAKLADPAWRCYWRNAASNASFCIRTSTGNTETFLSQKQVGRLFYRAKVHCDVIFRLSCSRSNMSWTNSQAISR